MFTEKSTPQSSICQPFPIDLRYLSDHEAPSGPRGIAHRLSPRAALIGLVDVELMLLTWSCGAGEGLSPGRQELSVRRAQHRARGDL